jgi:DNA mismatch endonuclease, patch repair protein
MRRVRTTGTGPELILRRALWRCGLRYRLSSVLPGKPDLAFPRERVAVFIDGCYWHGCPEHFKVPGTNTRFWQEKVDRNRMRDREVEDMLAAEGWTTFRTWEHDILRNITQVVADIRTLLSSPEGSHEDRK